MKKSILISALALAALATTSCSNEETKAIEPQSNAIEFGTYLGRDAISRAQALTTANLAHFGVFASYSAGAGWTDTNTMNFMFDQKVEKSGSDWIYTPLKYWPAKQGEKISFFAYAPYFAADGSTKSITIVSTNSQAGAPKVNFAINISDPAKMVDFTAGVVMDRTKTDNDESNVANTVKFKFHHELSRVNFVAKLDRDAFGADAKNKTKINITDVKIDGSKKLYASADYTFSTANDTESGYTKGTWSNHVETTSDFKITTLLNKGAASELGNYTTEGVLLPTTAEVALFKTNEYLFFIPSPASVTDDDVVNVTFQYDIITADAALDGGYVSSTATKTVSIKASNFAQGVAKKYMFTFGLHEIKVSAEVEDWPTEGSGDSTTVDWTDTDSSI